MWPQHSMSCFLFVQPSRHLCYLSVCVLLPHTERLSKSSVSFRLLASLWWWRGCWIVEHTSGLCLYRAVTVRVSGLTPGDTSSSVVEIWSIVDSNFIYLGWLLAEHHQANNLILLWAVITLFVHLSAETKTIKRWTSETNGQIYPLKTKYKIQMFHINIVL